MGMRRLFGPADWTVTGREMAEGSDCGGSELGEMVVGGRGSFESSEWDVVGKNKNVGRARIIYPMIVTISTFT